MGFIKDMCPDYLMGDNDDDYEREIYYEILTNNNEGYEIDPNYVDKNNIIERTLSVIEKYLGHNKPNVNDRIIEDLQADELDIVELVIALEEEFKIDICYENQIFFYRVGNIIDFIKTKI